MMGELYTAPAGTPPDAADAWTPVGHLVTTPPDTAPRRVRMTRQRPWRADHPDAVIVARPSKWGNPFTTEHGRAWAVDRFTSWLVIGGGRDIAEAARHELRGRDLACWCPLDEPCHADVLLEIANGDPR